MSDCSRAIPTRWADQISYTSGQFAELCLLFVLFQVKKVFNDIFGEEEGPVQFEKVFNSQCNQ